MTFGVSGRMEWLSQRCQKEAALRSVLILSCLLLVLSVSLYPGLWAIGVQLHSVFTGSYVPGHHSVLLVNSPNEQAAKDIGRYTAGGLRHCGSFCNSPCRAIMERRLAASVNILSRTSTMYYWKGEIQDASEILMLVKTKTSRIQQVTDYVRSFHPYANPEVLSFAVQDGSLSYMRWMDEAVPDD
ncbi:Protein CutA -like protein [Takifugu flavidus]|uniref:Protein CutA-like protein n=1 Tax=Takifugu flavidus TaxID=433684 RepID=A0A5C6NI82_9TELE|nr:Protein CutA -like protein [Takifugu flavidus]